MNRLAKPLGALAALLVVALLAAVVPDLAQTRATAHAATAMRFATIATSISAAATVATPASGGRLTLHYAKLWSSSAGQVDVIFGSTTVLSVYAPANTEVELPTALFGGDGRGLRAAAVDEALKVDGPSGATGYLVCRYAEE